MADEYYELPSVSPFDDISPYVPLLISAVDEHLKDSNLWDDPDTALQLMDDLIAWLSVNLPCP